MAERKIVYKAKLVTAGKTFESKGVDVLEALKNLPVGWENIKYKGVVTITRGKHKAEKLMYLKPLRAMIASELRKVGVAKQLKTLLEYGA